MDIEKKLLVCDNNCMNNKIWFKRKLYGWGWTPVTWEGWIIIFIWVWIFATAIPQLDHEWIKNVVFVVLATALLIFICYKKGEKPRWQWGKRIEDDQINKM